MQGGLNELFPLGAAGTNLPLPQLFEYASCLKPDATEAEGDGDDLADQIATTIIQETVERTQSNLIKHAQEKGFDAKQLGAILKTSGFKGFDASRWEAMIKAIDEAAETGAFEQ